MPAKMLLNPPPINQKQQAWHGLVDAATALAIAEATHNYAGFCVVITPDTESTERLHNELAFFCDESLPLLAFPDWETLPYDSFSPHQDIVSERLKTLYQLPFLSRGILVVPATTLMHRIAPKEYVISNSLLLEPGQKFDLQSIRTNLVDNGYRQVDTVYEHGEFAVRGAIIDIFPMGSSTPYRIDLFDEEIDQLRTFDPESQRTIERIDKVSVLPAHEYPFDKTAIQKFRQNWRTHFDIDPQICSIYQDVSSGLNAPGIEYYLPLFFSECANLFDYFPESTLLFSIGSIDQAMSEQWQQISQRYEERRHDPERPLLPPSSLYLPDNELFGAIKRFSRIKLDHTSGSNKDQSGACFNSKVTPSFMLDHHTDNPLAVVKTYIEQTSARILFCTESTGRKEALLAMLKKIDLTPVEQPDWKSFLSGTAPLSITTANIDRGLYLPESGIVIITESQLFGQQVMQRRRRSQSKDYQDQIIKNLAELQVDSPVVHIDHGVGRYRGLETIEVNAQAEEFLTLEYAGNAKLYVPIASLHLIARYTGNDEANAPLHTLGSDKWQKAKRKAAEQARDTAAELLEIHARRASREGIAFEIPEKEYRRFCADFPFEETEDQLSAIAATLNDMRSAQPMDRLICGDVGFGKTEVAMRAAFIAAQNSTQVAILVPTTLLAQQHFDSFSDRFANWPVNVAVISRFQTRDEQERIQTQVAAGQIDILIATHKLIVGNFVFKNLGLLIIDEEHRFGVRQKEKIKSLRSDIDILALTATPIPRTLNMAIAGIRDISIIVSPPAKRLAINTFIHRQENGVRREAINRELLRGGQVYLLYNDVSSIARKAKEIAELVPQARIGIAHGQMRERDLEKVMSDFYHKRFNLLICTTIIETGIDIPSANTIIIERADKFGLAQLHQLRGRVGRSHHQAYAYLLTPHRKSMTADAIKRLEAIANAQALGAGFTLATHDMEIRGAGELLGDNQSGHIQTVGFSLYAELIEQAVKSLKQGKAFNLEQPIQHGTEVNLHFPTLIPETYLPDVHARLVMYKRIANAVNKNALRELQVEMIDRFGLLPDPIKNLFEVTELKLLAQAMGIRKIDLHTQGGKLEFENDTQVQPQQLVKLIQIQPHVFKLEGANQLRIKMLMDSAQARINKTHELLDQLAHR